MINNLPKISFIKAEAGASTSESFLLSNYQTVIFAFAVKKDNTTKIQITTLANGDKTKEIPFLVRENNKDIKLVMEQGIDIENSEENDKILQVIVSSDMLAHFNSDSIKLKLDTVEKIETITVSQFKPRYSDLE